MQLDAFLLDDEFHREFGRRQGYVAATWTLRYSNLESRSARQDWPSVMPRGEDNCKSIRGEVWSLEIVLRRGRLDKTL